jgi:tripartite-type tricarboxylate transporter receptor subunit TctC
MIEAGFPDFISGTFNALFAPAGTPPEIVARLVKESQAAMHTPEAHEAARRAGYRIVASGPEQWARRVATEIQGVKEPVARAGIKVQ